MSLTVYFLSEPGSGFCTSKMVSSITFLCCLSLLFFFIFLSFFCFVVLFLKRLTIWLIPEDSEKAFAYFWITDSCPLTVKAISNRAPFEVLSLAGSISDALQI